jgi:hypothetical protein
MASSFIGPPDFFDAGQQHGPEFVIARSQLDGVVEAHRAATRDPAFDGAKAAEHEAGQPLGPIAAVEKADGLVGQGRCVAHDPATWRRLID